MTQHTEDLPAESQIDHMQDVAWHSQLAQQALIALQAACLAAGLWVVVAGATEIPGLRFMPALLIIAAAAGVASARWLAQPGQRLVGKTAFNLAQLLVILLALRVLTWALSGDWPTLASVRGWILEPLSFLDGFFVAAALLCALAWHRAAVVADIFYRLALSPGELAYDSERRSYGFWRMAHRTERILVSRSDIVEHYVTQWLVGGVFLGLFAAATRVRIGGGFSINVLSMGIPPQMAIAGVLYFLIGLVLLSQARLAVLRAQWLLDGVEMPERLPTRWSRVSLALILGVGLVASLLPLGSTWQLGAIVNTVVLFVYRLVVFIFFLVATLFGLIMGLMGEQPEMPEIPQELAPAPPAEPLVPIVEPPPWLGGATFWLIMVIVLLVALRLVLGRDGLDVTRRKLQTWLARFWAYLKSWGRGVQSLVRSIQISLPGRRAQAPEEAARQPWRFIRVGGLPPREQVRYFYLSTLRRAADQGIARQPAQTPSEFINDLEGAWPETELDVEALTGAFLTARYDAAEISPDEAQQVKSVWERIKRALRGGKRHVGTGGSDELH